MKNDNKILNERSASETEIDSERNIAVKISRSFISIIYLKRR